MRREQLPVRLYRPALVMLLALVMAALPSVVLAGRPGHAPSGYGRPGPGWPGPGPRMAAPMGLVGTVVEVTPGEVSESKGGQTDSQQAEMVLELESGKRAQHGMSRQLTLAVDEDAILLAADLAPLELASLAAGDTVLVTPKFVWGSPAVQLLYAGSAEDLAALSFHGRLVSSEGDTLQLQAHWDNDPLTVVVDDATHWIDDGPQARPNELPEGMPLRVLGVKQDDGSVRAVVIAAGRSGL